MPVGFAVCVGRNEMDQQSEPFASGRLLPSLLLLFVGSGCAALIYEIIWFQMLELMIGATTISLAVLLATYMGGLCLGSLALPRVISAVRHPLQIYATLELGIGVLGVAVLIALPYANEIYTAHVGRGIVGIVLRAGLSALLVLPPTVLMGATLPAVARWAETTPQGVSRLGLLYASNIVGAVFGCLLAGFYLLRLYDTAVATYVAASVNAALAVTAFALAAITPYRPRLQGSAAAPATRAQAPLVTYLVIGLSGLTALGAEVLWTRMLVLLLGNSVYTFSLILAVFLIGLGIGGGFGSLLARASARPRFALGVTQLLLVAAVAWAVAVIDGSLPYWPIDPYLMTSPWYNFELDFVRCVWMILPAACLWGASFPLALASLASRGEDPSRMVGAVYAANTIGAIVGALTFSIILIPSIGVYQSHRLLIGLCVAAGLMMLAPLMPQWNRRASAVEREQPLSMRASVGAAASSTAIAILLAWIIPPVPDRLVVLGRSLPRSAGQALRVLYAGEGINSWVSVAEWDDGYRTFHVSGEGEASNIPVDLRLQRMLGHLAALSHPKPHSVLIIGHGAGVTAGSFIPYPEIDRIVVCEIEPLIPRKVGPFFRKENYNLINDPRVEIIYDDARHYLFTSDEKFDIITTDPLQPWAKGAAMLYTKEFFRRAKSLLKPAGVITQYVQLFESSPAVVKSELATFFEVFPNGVVWGNEYEGTGFDTVAYGLKDPGPIDVDAIQQRLGRADYVHVANSLAEVQFFSAIDLFSTYAGQASDLKGWLQEAEINTDRNLRLQYVAGLGLNNRNEAAIYRDMLVHRKFPENLFAGSEATKETLRRIIESRPAKE